LEPDDRLCLNFNAAQEAAKEALREASPDNPVSRVARAKIIKELADDPQRYILEKLEAIEARLASSFASSQRLGLQVNLFFALIRHGRVTTKAISKALVNMDPQINNILVDWGDPTFVLVFFTTDFDVPEYKLQAALEKAGAEIMHFWKVRRDVA
jgi:hypothetical protein